MMRLRKIVVEQGSKQSYRRNDFIPKKMDTLEESSIFDQTTVVQDKLTLSQVEKHARKTLALFNELETDANLNLLKTEMEIDEGKGRYSSFGKESSKLDTKLLNYFDHNPISLSSEEAGEFIITRLCNGLAEGVEKDILLPLSLDKYFGEIAELPTFDLKSDHTFNATAFKSAELTMLKSLKLRNNLKNAELISVPDLEGTKLQKMIYFVYDKESLPPEIRKQLTSF